MNRLSLIPLLSCISFLLFLSCKSKQQVTVERDVVMLHDTVREIHRDTLRQISFHRDTLYSRDSIYMELRGDTLIREVYRYRYRDRLVIDTLYRSIGDTATEKAAAVAYKTRTVKEVVEVERKLRWWQKALQWTGGFCWGFFAIFVAYVIARYKRNG